MKYLFATLMASALFQVAHAGELTVFDHRDFRGNEVTLRQDAPNFRDLHINDGVSSMIVRSGVWEVCEHKDFGGGCAVFRPGEYADLRGLNDKISSAREIIVRGGPRDRDGDGRPDGHHRDGRWRDGDHRGDRDDGEGDAVKLFAGPRFEGQTVDIDDDVDTLRDEDFNDRAGSLIVRRGTWQLCEHAEYRGQCVVFGPGRYPFLEGMNNRISSLRRVR